MIALLLVELLLAEPPLARSFQDAVPQIKVTVRM